jgi:hypothetical protein
MIALVGVCNKNYLIVSILQFDGIVIIYIAQFRTRFKIECFDLFFLKIYFVPNIEVGWFCI